MDYLFKWAILFVNVTRAEQILFHILGLHTEQLYSLVQCDYRKKHSNLAFGCSTLLLVGKGSLLLGKFHYFENIWDTVTLLKNVVKLAELMHGYSSILLQTNQILLIIMFVLGLLWVPICRLAFQELHCFCDKTRTANLPYNQNFVSFPIFFSANSIGCLKDYRWTENPFLCHLLLF